MDTQPLFTLDQAHEKFAKSLNGRTWELLGKVDRTTAEDKEMVLAASASLYHWLQVGSAVNDQRGEWLLARVFTVLRKSDLALEHAQLCYELTEAHKAEMQDFDLFYAHEAMARALALNGDREKARGYKARAAAAAEKVADPEDKNIVMGDLQSGPWFDVE